MKSKNEQLVIIGSTIRKIRKSKGITLIELSDLSGVDRCYIGAVERGEHNIAMINLIKIASGIGVSLEQLFALSKL